MRAQLLHLSGPLRGRTITYKQPVVHVGRAPSSEVGLTHALVADEHARIEWVQDECKFHLRRVDGKVFVNGNEVEEIILKDGDMLEFGAGGPTARFRTYVPIGAVCKPVRRMLGDAAEVRRHSGAVAATRTLTSDLLTQATLQLKVGFPILVLLVAAGLYYWFGDQLSKAEARITADRISREQLQEALAEYRAEIDRLNKEMGKQDATIGKLSGMLNNENFVARAPEDVIAKNRAQLAEAEQAKVGIQAALDRLSALG